MYTGRTVRQVSSPPCWWTSPARTPWWLLTLRLLAASLVIGVFYFLFIIVADTLRANAKLHPELLVWFPNVLFLGLGIWLFWRVSRQ